MKEGKDGSRRDQVEGGCLIQVSGARDSPRAVAEGLPGRGGFKR